LSGAGIGMRPITTLMGELTLAGRLQHWTGCVEVEVGTLPPY
jgi:hypothetical protein